MKSSYGFLLKRFRDISKNKRKTETNDFKVSGKPLGSGFTTELNKSDELIGSEILDASKFIKFIREPLSTMFVSS